MEPGHGDREEFRSTEKYHDRTYPPQWSPVTETGKRSQSLLFSGCDEAAAMEPGHGDREETVIARLRPTSLDTPQWSPVTETGKSHA